jgi:hypothetical protein
VQAVGRVTKKTIKAHGKSFKQTWIYVPSELAEAKGFPFEQREQVLIIVDEKKRRLVVEKLEARTV